MCISFYIPQKGYGKRGFTTDTYVSVTILFRCETFKARW